MNPTLKASLFERNPKSTISIIIGTFFLLTLSLSESYFSHKNDRARSHDVNTVPYRTDIWLREWPANLDKCVIDNYLWDKTTKVEANCIDFKTDEHGFLLPGSRHTNPDIKIVFLGGSTTESMFVRPENRFPGLVNTILERNTGMGINSYNGGKSGNTSFDAINLYFNKIIPLQADIVILMNNINDLSTLIYEQSYWNMSGSRGPYKKINQLHYTEKPLKERLKSVVRSLKHLFPNTVFEIEKFWRSTANSTGKIAIDEFETSRGVKKNLNVRKMQRMFQYNLMLFVDMVHQNGKTPVLMTQFNRIIEDPKVISEIEGARIGVDFYEYKFIYESFNDIIRKVANLTNTLLIDLDKDIPKDPNLFFDTIHVNDDGSKLVAKVISKKLEELIN